MMTPLFRTPLGTQIQEKPPFSITSRARGETTTRAGFKESLLPRLEGNLEKGSSVLFRSFLLLLLESFIRNTTAKLEFEPRKMPPREGRRAYAIEIVILEWLHRSYPSDTVDGRKSV